MIVETRNLSKRFDATQAVQGLSLSVPNGAVMALVGGNGAGKTTTLRLLANLLQPDDGDARVLGVDSRSLGAAQYAQLGYVSEDLHLPAGLTVDQFFAYLRPLYPTWDRALEGELRTRLRLPADRKLGQLSHGMRTKTRLAAALPHRPSLLMLDEPLGGLDPLARDEVLESLIGDASGATILISSHELAEIETCATHIAFMDAGRLLVQDNAVDFASRFRDVRAGFLGQPSLKAGLPDSWLMPQWGGRTLRFTATDYAGDEDLRRRLSSLLGPLAHLSAEPMSLRDTSKALMSAYREEAVR